MSKKPHIPERPVVIAPPFSLEWYLTYRPEWNICHNPHPARARVGGTASMESAMLDDVTTMFKLGTSFANSLRISIIEREVAESVWRTLNCRPVLRSSS